MLMPPDQKNLEAKTLRRFVSYLVAICIGVAGTLAWQSYGQVAKQMLAAKAPELGWSPESKQMVANLVEQLGWTKPVAVAPQAPATPPIDPEQVHQIVVDLTALHTINDGVRELGSDRPLAGARAALSPRAAP